MKHTCSWGIGLAAAALVLWTGTEESRADLRIIFRPLLPRPFVVIPVRPIPPPVVVPSAPPAPAGLGRVNLLVRPAGTRVMVDGKPMGVADDFDGNPGYLVLPVGEHRVVLTLDGFKPLEFIVRVEPVRVVTLDVNMKPAEAVGTASAAVAAEANVFKVEIDATGSVSFDVTPADAVVYLNNVYYGPASEFTESSDAIALKEGANRVEIMRPGYKNHVQDITIQRGEKKVIKVTLDKAE